MLAAAAVLAIALPIEAVALRAQTLGIVLIATLAGLGAIVFAARADMEKIALGAAYLCAFTLAWNGWYVGPVRPGDVLILVALLCFAAGAPLTVFKSPPWWVKQLVIALAIGVLLIVLFPPDRMYLLHRHVLDAGGRPIYQSIDNIARSNIGVAAKFIVSVAAIPIAFTAAALLDNRAPKRLAVAFVAGTSLSGLVAFIDHTRIASIGHYLTHLPAGASSRAVGFSYHPNFLAAGLVLAIPFACWLLTSKVRLEKQLGAICLLSDLLGVYASGSRGGAACAVGAVGLACALLPRTRPHLPAIVMASAVAGVAVAAVFPSFGLKLLRVTRLVGDPAAAGSNSVRAQLAAQGNADFHHSPLHGIGLQVSTQASQVYLQELASGGLLLFAAMSVYMLTAAWESWKLIAVDPLAAAILSAVGATLVLNIFEADLTDRFYYVPEAILVAMLTLIRQQRSSPADVRTAVVSRNFAPAEAIA